MEKIKLSKLITEVALSKMEFSPFDDLFDGREFQAAVDHKIGLLANNVDIDQKGISLITALQEIGILIRNYRQKMQEIITTMNISSDEFIKYLIAYANITYLNVKEEIQNDKKNSGKIEDINSIELGHFINLNGDSVTAMNINDAVNDTCAEIIRMVLKVNHPNNGSAQIAPGQIPANLHKLFRLGSMVYDLRTVYNTYQYEFGAIDKQGDIIYFRQEPEQYFKLKTANKQREKNLRLETFMAGKQFKETEKNAPIINVNSGEITFSKSNKPDKTNFSKMVSANFLTFYFHLHLTPLKDFQGKFFNDAISIIEYIRVFFNNFDSLQIIKQAEKHRSIDFIPYRISQTHLVDFLVQESGQPKDLVGKIVSQLTSNIKPEMDIWAKPFFSVGDELYFLLGPLAGGDLSYQLDRMLDDLINPDVQLNNFRDLLELELDHRKEKKHTFEKVDVKHINTLKELNGLIVYKTLNKIIVLQFALIKYPFDAEDSSRELKKLYELDDHLQHNLTELGKNSEALFGNTSIHLYGIIITNHPTFSGITLNRTPVLDFILFKNYITTGKYTKALLLMGNGEMHTDKISSYDYFIDDESFDKNLLSFSYQPAPLIEILPNLIVKTFKLTPNDSSPVIFGEYYTLREMSESVSKAVEELEFYLKQLYFFNADHNRDPAGKELMTTRILYLIPLTFNYFAIDRTNHEARLKLLTSFKRAGIDGTIYLIQNVDKLLGRLSKKKIKAKESSVSKSINHQKAQVNFQIIVDNNQSENPVRFSELKLKHTFSGEDIDEVIRFLFFAIASYVPKKYEEEDINACFNLLAFAVSLVEGKDDYQSELYTSCINFIEMLNYSGFNQRARDFAEELLDFSFKNETIPILGWLGLFKCYTRQKNVNDAAFYGNAFLSVINSLPEIKEEFLIEALYSSLLFFRNFGYTPLTDALYESLLNFKLSSYNLQKVTLSYFNSRLRDPATLNKTLEAIEAFLNENILKIIPNGQLSCLPWIVLIYNFKNFELKGILTVPASILDYLVPLENELDSWTLKDLRGQFFPDSNTSGEILVQALYKSFETRSFEDYAAEISGLELVANNVISISTDPLDLDKLLLTGLVINDQSLSFIEGETGEINTFIKEKDEELLKTLQHYSDYLLSKLVLTKGQIVCWIFEYENHVCALYINHEKKAILSYLEEWNINAMKQWQSKIDNYYFDEKNGYFINEQEADYIADLKKLSFAHINIPFDCSELLISYSLEMASFPPQLLSIPQQHFNEEHYQLHEKVVKELIDEEKFDFIGFHKPVTNIISLEYFTSNAKTIELPKAALTIEGWIPTVDEDYVLFLAEKTLRPLFEEKFQVKLQNSVYPKPALQANVNVFVAHGATSVFGFKSIHTRGQDAGHAIIDNLGMEIAFGKGLIAIVFICDSGSFKKDIYNQKLVSFVHQLLSQGYTSVVAPSWKYNPAITNVWLDNFMESLGNGEALSFAVHKANLTSAKKGFDNDNGFYSPRGWAAMHLYGNPNISFNQG